MEKVIKKKKGGQAWQSQCVEHGFYAKGLRKMEIKELEKISEGLEEEIGLMRSIIRRVAENAVDENDRRELIGLLDSIGAAGVRLASMIRTQKVFFKANPLEDALSEAIDMVQAEWAEEREKEQEENDRRLG